MPIQSPKLDDLDYKSLQTSLINQIPLYTREWTDYNDSDPGITLIQLFSHLAEQITYRLNQVPEKNYIEFLKLLGIRLRPAEPASSVVNFVLTKPETVEQFLIDAGARIAAKSEAEVPPVFETVLKLDVIPAQMATLITSRSNKLTNINPGEAGPGTGDVDEYIKTRFSIAWDGKKPKLKDMSVSPVALFQRNSEHTHKHLWIGLAFNPAVTAGFLGARVTLRLQLDDDEQPVADGVAQCGEPAFELDAAPGSATELVSYEFYRPPGINEAKGKWMELAVLGDSTEGWTRSGEIRFDVPRNIGAIPDDEWESVAEGILHPLIGKLKNPVQGTPDFVPISGWLHVKFNLQVPMLLLRALSFNVTTVIGAETVRNEQLGFGSGEVGQRMQLGNDNILSDTLSIVSVGPAPQREQRHWRQVSDFYNLDPFDRVYVLDAEAGEVVFGDGMNGRPPEVGEQLIASQYRHGGGEYTEVDVGMVSLPESLPVMVESATNIVAARGGKDAETLLDAKQRAALQQKVQRRAVTTEDFEFHTLQTTGVRVARAVVVPLYIPYPQGNADQRGLDFDTRVPGAVTVIVIPDEEGLYPTPTEGMLRTVCRYLDKFRLITTEVYTTVAQYVRIHNLTLELKAEVGYSRTRLREAIAEHLERYFHVLTGGEEGKGFPFGVTVHHADLVAQVFRVAGVDRVEALEAWFDGQSPAGAVPEMHWRQERQTPRRLINCIEGPDDDVKIVLQGDETLFIDSSSVNIIIKEGS